MTSDEQDDIANNILVFLNKEDGYRSIQQVDERGFDVVRIAMELHKIGLIEDYKDPDTDYNPFMYQIRMEGKRIAERPDGYKGWVAEQKEHRESEFRLLKENLKYVKPLKNAVMWTALSTFGLLLVELWREFQPLLQRLWHLLCSM